MIIFFLWLCFSDFLIKPKFSLSRRRSRHTTEVNILSVSERNDRLWPLVDSAEKFLNLDVPYATSASICFIAFWSGKSLAAHYSSSVLITQKLSSATFLNSKFSTLDISMDESFERLFFNNKRFSIDST